MYIMHVQAVFRSALHSHARVTATLLRASRDLNLSTTVTLLTSAKTFTVSSFIKRVNNYPKFSECNTTQYRTESIKARSSYTQIIIHPLSYSHLNNTRTRLLHCKSKVKPPQFPGQEDPRGPSFRLCSRNLP